MEPGVPGSSPGGGTILDESVAPHLKSPQARYAARAAEAMGYAFRSLDGDDGYLFEVRDVNGKIQPVKEREIIRAAGPTVHPHAGKQAEKSHA